MKALVKIAVLTTALLVLLSSSQSVSADKILFLLPISSKSHFNVFEPLLKALGERGHEVINLSPFKIPNMPPNVRQIQIATLDEIMGHVGNPFDMRKIGMLQTFMNGSFNSMLDVCEKVVKTDTFQDLITKETFDLIFTDVPMDVCSLGVIPLMKAPSILVTTFAAPSYVTNDFGNRLPPSFVPDSMLDLTHKMSFPQRMQNLVLGSIMELIFYYMFNLPGEDIYRRNLPNGDNLPGIHEIQKNASMIFSNSHFSLNHPRPLLPDTVEVGGMHCRPAKPLPKDINDFISGAGKDGVIFFSLGSVVPAKLMPEEIRKKFINVFSRLKQRVIWKWETESMPDLPPNVLLKKWCPQQDILGHPNIKLFMTHGGLLSTQESVYHGVPVLGFPVFGDQDMNVKRAETAGYGKFMEILDMTEEKLEKAIREILDSPKYLKKAKELSVLVRDLPQTPLETAVYWTEYVLRHKGATHLRSAARDLNFFQYYVLDVTLALALLLLGTLLTFYITLRACFRKCFGKKGSPKRGETKGTLHTKKFQ